MPAPPADAVRVLSSLAADDLAVMRWTLTTVQATIRRRMNSRLFRSAELQEQAVKFKAALNHFDQGYLEGKDVVVLLSAFYALEDHYAQAHSLDTRPPEAHFKTVFEMARRLPYLTPLPS